MDKIYMLAGKARHGKDTTGEFIKEYYEKKGKKVVTLQLSSPLKYYANKVLGWDGNEETKPREFLQKVGTDIIRGQIDEKFLIKRLIADIKVLSYFCDIIVVTDVRIPLEFEEIEKEYDNVVKVLVRRTNFETVLTGKEQKHLTETALDTYSNYDYIIENDSTLESLKSKVEKLLEVNK